MEALQYQPGGSEGHFWLTSAELTLHFTHLYWFEDLTKGGHLEWSLTTSRSTWNPAAASSDPVVPDVDLGRVPPFTMNPIWSLVVKDEFPTACHLLLTHGPDMVAPRGGETQDADGEAASSRGLPSVGLAVVRAKAGERYTISE